MITLYTILFGRIQKYLSSHNICPHKYTRIRDRTVNMALRSKIHHIIRSLPLKEFHHKIAVSDVSADKFVIRLVLYRLQGFQVSRIRKKIQIDDLVLGILFYHMMHKISTDKSGATCH